MQALQRIPAFLKSNGWLLLILCWGAFLRFWAFYDIPFVLDEFSALSRLSYHSFSGLIEQGVLPDFHPAGVQAFLWVYVRLFGSTPWVVKLPFAVMGLTSIWLMYFIGKDWFGKQTGLLTASLATCTQYFIFYSQIARPYGPGLLFSLLALFFWKKWVIDKSRSFWVWLAWILSATAVAYIHYFALLFLVLVGLSGLLFTRGKRLWGYVGSGLLIILLYLPHFPIFFHQLSKGGVESWLAKPGVSFVPDYLGYLFHFSPLFMGIMLLVLAMGLFYPLKGSNKVLAWLGVLWWVTCFLIGFYYSVYRNAILQFSGLLFVAPFGIMGVFSLFRSRSKYISYSIGLILLTGTWSLVQNRAHYEMLYQSPYEQFVKNISALDAENTAFVLAEEEHILRYYARQYGVDETRIIEANKHDLKTLAAAIEKLETPALALGLMYYAPQEILAYAREKYPHLLRHAKYYQGDFYLLSNSKKAVSPAEEGYFEKENLVEHPAILFPEKAYGPSIEVYGIDTLVKHPLDRFSFSAEVSRTDIHARGALVSALMLGDSVLDWQASDMIFLDSAMQAKQYHSFQLKKELLRQKETVLQLFVWNTGQDSLSVHKQKVQIRHGNPYLYALSHDF